MCEKEKVITEIIQGKNFKSDKTNKEVSEVLQNANVINWAALAKKVYNELKEEIEILDRKPSLKIILVGDNPSSVSYVKQKEKWANFVWIDYEKIHFDVNISEEELLNKINELNNDENTNWFMVQLPLPNWINESNIINAIDPKKDVDWFASENQWKILQADESWLVPCTPAWIIELLESIDCNVKWKQVTILWKSNIVWKPIANILMNMWATVISCDVNTKDIYKYTKDSDIVISATWVIHLIKKEHIKNDAVIIDVWFEVKDWKIYWDCDFDSIIKTWAKITPVPGWVWAMTVAMLMKNTLKAFKNKEK